MVTEAYVNMDIRTTVHNTAIRNSKVKGSEISWSGNSFRVSRHSGARPLCYPYQRDAIFLGITQVGRLLMGR